MGYPRDMPQGHVPGGTPPPVPHPPRCSRGVLSPRRSGTGLWAQEGSRVRAEGRARALRALAFLYPRLFPPGRPKPYFRLQPKYWIGSRSSPPQGGPDVQDLVGLTLPVAAVPFSRDERQQGAASLLATLVAPVFRARSTSRRLSSERSTESQQWCELASTLLTSAVTRTG